MRAYAIGDIHGQYERLLAAHALVEADRAAQGDDTAPLVHVGDLCDRGPETRRVIDHLIAQTLSDPRVVVLRGNHDRMMEYFLRDPSKADPRLRPDLDWLDPRLGGRRTLGSYGIDPDLTEGEMHAEGRREVPEAHRRFLATRPLTHRHGALFFCHAGVRPGVALEAQVEDDLVWIREPFLTSEADHGALVVHGHTVVDEVTHYGNRLNLDTGAGYGKPLSAVVIEGREAYLLTEEGRTPVRRARPAEA